MFFKVIQSSALEHFFVDFRDIFRAKVDARTHPLEAGFSDRFDHGRSPPFWGHFGVILVARWLPFGAFRVPFGSLWAPFGSFWCPCGALLVRFGSLVPL